jgi:phosphoglycerate kinase
MDLDKLKTTAGLDVRGKRVLVRADLNVPVKDGKITDATRLERLVPGLQDLARRGAKVIVISHFGRPKGGPDPQFSLKPVAAKLAELMGRPVAFAGDCVGEPAANVVAALRDGDVAVLENLRFHKGEEKNDPVFAELAATNGDIFVNDAFSAAHRAHASTEGLGHVLPAFAGRAMEAELTALGKALDAPARPLAAIVGGAKVSTKLELLGNLIAKVNVLIIGGGMANTFLAGRGKSVGKSLCEHDLAKTARDILAQAKAMGCEIVLPVDAVVAQKFEAHAPSRVVPVDGVGPADMILDIGPKSIEQVVSVLARMKTLVWNGPFGAFEMEPFDTGTVEVAEAAAEKRVNVIDACMTAVPRLVREGGLTFLVGGQKAFFERAKPHLRNMSKDVVHMGPLGCGNVTKLYKNMVTASEALIVWEALQIAKAAGISPKAALDLMQKTRSAHVLERWEGRYQINGNEVTFNPGTNLYDKDLPLAADVGKALGAEIPVVEALAKLGIKLNGGKVSI